MQGSERQLPTLVGYSYSNVILFTVSAELIGLVMTYYLGILFHYDILMRTHCTVSGISVYMMHNYYSCLWTWWVARLSVITSLT